MKRSFLPFLLLAALAAAAAGCASSGGDDAAVTAVTLAASSSPFLTAGEMFSLADSPAAGVESLAAARLAGVSGTPATLPAWWYRYGLTPVPASYEVALIDSTTAFARAHASVVGTLHVTSSAGGIYVGPPDYTPIILPPSFWNARFAAAAARDSMFKRTGGEWTLSRVSAALIVPTHITPTVRITSVQLAIGGVPAYSSDSPYHLLELPASPAPTGAVLEIADSTVMAQAFSGQRIVVSTDVTAANAMRYVPPEFLFLHYMDENGVPRRQPMDSLGMGSYTYSFTVHGLDGASTPQFRQVGVEVMNPRCLMVSNASYDSMIWSVPYQVVPPPPAP
jgi:hypothetical protein